MRVEGQQPAEPALSCYVSEGRTLVRYRFDRVEVQGSPSEVGIKTLFRLIEVAVEVVDLLLKVGDARVAVKRAVADDDGRHDRGGDAGGHSAPSDLSEPLTDDDIPF